MGIDEVVLVFGRYDVLQSIKHQERVRRGLSLESTTASHVITGNRIVPNYRTFLKSSGNKAALSAFVCNYVLEKGPEILLEHQCIVLAGGFQDGQYAVKISKKRVANMEEMSSSHEEADTRMVLHAINMSDMSDTPKVNLAL